MIQSYQKVIESDHHGRVVGSAVRLLARLHAEVAEAEAGQVGAHDGVRRAEELHHQLCRKGEAAGQKSVIEDILQISTPAARPRRSMQPN